MYPLFSDIYEFSYQFSDMIFFPKFLSYIYAINLMGTTVHYQCVCGHIHRVWGHFDFNVLPIVKLSETSDSVFFVFIAYIHLQFYGDYCE